MYVHLYIIHLLLSSVPLIEVEILQCTRRLFFLQQWNLSQWRTTTGHVIGPTCHYDVIDFVLVAKRRGHYDVIDFVFVAKQRDIMTSLFLCQPIICTDTELASHLRGRKPGQYITGWYRGLPVTFSVVGTNCSLADMGGLLRSDSQSWGSLSNVDSRGWLSKKREAIAPCPPLFRRFCWYFVKPWTQKYFLPPFHHGGYDICLFARVFVEPPRVAVNVCGQMSPPSAAPI